MLTISVTASPPAPASRAGQPSALPGVYAIGSPALSEIYVSPSGDDGNSGLSPGSPLRTIGAAWGRLPASTAGTGYRINLLPGTYPCEPGEPDNCQNYFSDRAGSYASPIIMRALGGLGSATIRGGLNLSRLPVCRGQ